MLVIGDVLSNPILTDFLRLKKNQQSSSQASPNIPSLFSKLHVLHRKGPTLSTSTRAPGLVFWGRMGG